jgi:putative flavoprotein involved in K+ transport
MDMGGLASSRAWITEAHAVANGDTSYDVVVVGGGQAGLAIGYFLAQQGRHFAILEREHDVAAAWRDRWDSLALFTPRAYDSLPGRGFPGDPDGYPTRDEVVAYLKDYAAHFDLPVRLGTPARRLSRDGDQFVIELDGARITANQVVIATGPFQEPRIPAFAAGLEPEVVQLHSTGYRLPADLPTGRALVVGGGNTGYQIAHELAATRETHIAIGTPQAALPQRLFGRDLFFFLTKTGLIYKSLESRLGQRMKAKETLVGPLPKIAKQLGVISHGRATGAVGRTITFADGSQIDVDGIVWATGFRYDHSWIGLSITDDRGLIKHRRGVTEIPGLYTLGLQWQWTRGSALLGFVKDDAAFIAEQIVARAGSVQREDVPATETAEVTTAAQGG